MTEQELKTLKPGRYKLLTTSDGWFDLTINENGGLDLSPNVGIDTFKVLATLDIVQVIPFCKCKKCKCEKSEN